MAGRTECPKAAMRACQLVGKMALNLAAAMDMKTVAMKAQQMAVTMGDWTAASLVAMMAASSVDVWADLWGAQWVDYLESTRVVNSVHQMVVCWAVMLVAWKVVRTAAH